MFVNQNDCMEKLTISNIQRDDVMVTTTYLERQPDVDSTIFEIENQRWKKYPNLQTRFAKKKMKMCDHTENVFKISRIK